MSKRVALLAPGISIHTQRWLRELAFQGFEVHLITMHAPKEALPKDVSLHQLPFRAPLGYFFNTWKLRSILRQLKPDIYHVHYASGYGTLARLAGRMPYILSVWGTDVFSFPFHSFLHRWWIQKNLRSARWICSTSHTMADKTIEILKSTPTIHITPFGVDTKKFFPARSVKSVNKRVNLGTLRPIHHRYGQDVLLKAFAELLQRPTLAHLDLHLVLGGDGPHRQQMIELVESLRLHGKITLSGKLPHESVPEFLNSLDIFVVPSRTESFGVAALEASACGVPVVASRVGGLREVVQENVTGVFFESESVLGLADALESLILDVKKREELGLAGRDFVFKNYSWEASSQTMTSLYTKILEARA